MCLSYVCLSWGKLRKKESCINVCICVCSKGFCNRGCQELELEGRVVLGCANNCRLDPYSQSVPKRNPQQISVIGTQNDKKNFVDSDMFVNDTF